MTFALTFCAVLVGNYETVVHLAAQSNETVAAPGTRSRDQCSTRTGATRHSVGSNALIVPGQEIVDGIAPQGKLDTISIYLAVLKQRSFLYLQHVQLGVLHDEKSHVYGQGIRQ